MFVAMSEMNIGNRLDSYITNVSVVPINPRIEWSDLTLF